MKYERFCSFRYPHSVVRGRTDTALMDIIQKMEQESTVCVRKLILQQLMVDGMCDEDCAKKTPSTQCCVGCDMALQKALSLWQPQSPHTKERRHNPALCYINGFVVYFCYVIYNKCYIPHLKLYCSDNIPFNQTTCPSPLPKHSEDKISLQWGHINIIGSEMNRGRAIAEHILRHNMEEFRNLCINDPLLI